MSKERGPRVRIEPFVADFSALAEVVRDVGERCSIWADIDAEIGRARDKHGTQHDLPIGTGPDVSYLEELDHAASDLGLWTDDYYTLDFLTNTQVADAARHLEQTSSRGESGSTWYKVLLEEVLEAGAEDDPAALDAELVQAGAMVVSMLQALRRQQAEVNAS